MEEWKVKKKEEKKALETVEINTDDGWNEEEGIDAKLAVGRRKNRNQPKEGS
jgi:hypothetical protein